MQAPVIGVVPLWDEKKDSLWMHPGYMDGIKYAGGLPVMLPLTSDKAMIRQICAMVDGLLFTGGHDIFPGIYGEEVLDCCGPLCVERDNMEAMLFSEADASDNLPVFGICRGLQLFNALLGGTLYQDLPSQYRGKPSIGHKQKQPDDVFSNEVLIDKKSPLYALLNSDHIEVNSLHHQGIRDLSPKLECMAIAEDGLIEAVCMPEKRFAWAVQWHPELTLYDEYSHMLFEAFVAACNLL
jgi:putative glutamine amidotransferase